MLNLLQSCFNKRQSTVINHVVFQGYTLSVGIPQGFCWGLLLFIVFINDILSCTKINMRFFADDACSSYQHSDPACVSNVINEELRKFYVWLLTNKPSINYFNTNFFLFKQQVLKMLFQSNENGFSIEQSESIKCLGVDLDKKLNWMDHLRSLKSKLSINLLQ